MPTNPLPDPVIEEIRAVRSRISADCDHDPEKSSAITWSFSGGTPPG